MELMTALTVAKTCTLNGKSNTNFTLLNITTATNTIIETVHIKTFALLSFFSSVGCNINIVVLIFYFG